MSYHLERFAVLRLNRRNVDAGKNADNAEICAYVADLCKLSVTERIELIEILQIEIERNSRKNSPPHKQSRMSFADYACGFCKVGIIDKAVNGKENKSRYQPRHAEASVIR